MKSTILYWREVVWLMNRIYISASTQSKNIGILQYGTEQDRMQYFADRVKFWLKTQGDKFEVFRNQAGWTLEQTVKDCNNLACAAFVDYHSDAGPASAEGTSAFYCGQNSILSKGFILASTLYKYAAKMSPGKDRGVKPDTVLYASGLYVIQHTTPPAALIEVIFHTNAAEVTDFLKNIDQYAKEQAKGWCEYFGEKWEEPLTKEQSVDLLVKGMLEDGIITDKVYWTNVLLGITPASPEWLQIVFRRAVSKI